MIQELIVYIIIFSSVIYSVYHIYTFFKNTAKSGCNCSGCNLNPDIAHIKSLIKNK